MIKCTSFTYSVSLIYCLLIFKNLRFIFYLFIIVSFSGCDLSEAVHYGDAEQNPPQSPSGPPCDYYQSNNYYCIDNVDTQQDINKISGLSIIDRSLYILSTDLSDLEFLTRIKNIQGMLRINGNKNLTTISSVPSITTVNGLEISSNPLLKNLHGLDNIKAVPGDFLITSNVSLQSLGGLSAGTTSATVAITNNDLLTDLTALNELSSVKNLDLQSAVQNLNNLSKLTNVENNLNIAEIQSDSLSGLENLQSVGGRLSISSNDNLLNLDGLNQNVAFGSFAVTNNPALQTLPILTQNYAKDIYVTGSSLTNLDGLANITTVQNVLVISRNPLIIGLQGLANLQQVGILEVDGNDSLVSLEGLNSNVTFGTLQITNNSKLTELLTFTSDTANTVDIEANNSLVDLSGLANLATLLGSLIIAENPMITSLNDFANLQQIDYELDVTGNDNILSLDGLNPNITVNNLTIMDNPKLLALLPLTQNTISDVTIIGNNALADLSSLASLTTVLFNLDIRENPKLTSLHDLANLQSVNRIYIFDNPNLTTLGMGSLSDVSQSFEFISNNSLRDRLITPQKTIPHVTILFNAKC